MYKHEQLILSSVFVIAVALFGLGIYLYYSKDNGSSTTSNTLTQAVETSIAQSPQQAVAGDVNVAVPEITANIIKISSQNGISNVSIFVNISNTTGEKVEFSPFIDLFVKANGKTYTLDDSSTLQAGPIENGSSINGEIIVQIPELSADSIKLNFQPNNSDNTLEIDLSTNN